MKKFTISFTLCLSMICSGKLIAQNVTQTIQSHLEELLENKQITPLDMQYEITDQHISRTSGVNHVYYRQTLNGLQIYGTQSDIHFLPSGEVLTKNNQFIRNAAEKMVGSSTPSLTAIQAVQEAANQLNYNVSEPLSVISSLNTPNQEALISDGGISLTPIPVKLMYHINERQKVYLVWDLSIQENSRQDWWNVRIDATTGQILDQSNYMNSCSLEHDHSEVDHTTFVGPINKNESVLPSVFTYTSNETNALDGTYNVYALPVESPNFGTRSLLVDPENIIASPFGWHDTDGIPGAESTLTTGNNVDAHKGSDRPDGGPGLNFDFPIDLDENPATNTPPYLTNLFYLNNIMHDVYYQYGFDEVSGNFQENNYGNGGVGSDSVNANGQVGNVCNANFGTPPDGQNPTMNMYICNGHDGNLDGGVVTHEYGHGVDRRLVAGPSNVNCNDNTEKMGEGICDWLGMMLTIEPGDTGLDPRGVGTYLLGQAPDGPGVRNYRYSTDLAINPQTYADLPGTGGQTHNVGEIWGVTIWEVAWSLIDEHGWDPDVYTFTGDVDQDAGNVQAMALIIEGLKLQPCNSGFVDARDAIFAADQAIYEGANECLLWDAFAKRGLGFSADQGSSNSHTDGTPAYDSPVPALDTSDDLVCVSQGVQTYGGGTPTGGEYSGPGVTDDGNGLTYTFDPAVAGIGVHSIEYNVSSACASGTVFDDLEVITDVPEITCQDFTLELDENGEATLTMHDVVTNLEPGVASFTEDFNSGLPDGWSTVVNTGNCDWINSATPPIGGSFGSLAMIYDDDECGNGSPPSNVSLLSDVYDLSGNTIVTLNYEVGFYEFGSGQTFVTEVWDGADWQQVALVDSNMDPQPVSMDVSAYVNADFQVRWTYDDNNGEWGWYAGVDNFQLDYDIPGYPADNCGNTTTITLSQELFTCDDLGENTVTVTITDTDGNTNTCTPTITILDPLEVCLLNVEDSELYNHVVLFPNPTYGMMTLENRTSTQLISAVITDVNGRIIKSVDLSSSAISTQFSVAELATGLYFVEISTESTSIVKRIVKQ
jgi:hypothetical protein